MANDIAGKLTEQNTNLGKREVQEAARRLRQQLCTLEFDAPLECYANELAALCRALEGDGK